jgi:beta-1,4-N-acetylglucosaminyltransferase
MRNADLIIGHAGAGTCMEALSFGKPLLVVVNNKLLHNHQIELAERLANDQYCLIARSPEEVPTVLEDPRLMSPVPFPRPTNESVFIEFINKVMNFA